MKVHFKNLAIVFTFLLIANACQTRKEISTETSLDPLAYVDPFIGTGFHGHTFPGPTMPFGMVQLSPDTRLPGWDASSGYHYSDSTIYGFSHTHLSGTGIGDMGDILFLPFTGEVKDTLIARFDKADESAEVGHYQVKLKNFKVQAELGVTPRSGMHRYTYPSQDSQQLLVDLGHILQANWGHRSLYCKLEILDNQTIRGERISSGWAYDHRVYFYAKFDQAFELLQAKDGLEILSGNILEGQAVKAWFAFPENESQEILIKVGISSVSMEGAQKNLEAENPEWDFDQLVENSKTAWRKALGKIQIQSASETILTNFYTGLYHTMVAPMLSQDVDGQYRGIDKKIHQAPVGFNNYTVFSLWDTFRALHPLMSILDEKRTGDWVQSLLRKYQEGGVLPKWPLASNYTGTMVGYPAVSVIADAIAKDIPGINKELALKAAVYSSGYHPETIVKLPEPRAVELMPKHLYFIENNGYIPADSIEKSVSYGLECAYYDWCIAQMAKNLGQDSIATTFEKRANYYQHYFDPESRFMRGKLANGTWREPFNPFYSDHDGNDYVEGNAWQWSWFVPHDAIGLIDLMGGKQAFINQLDSLFTASSKIEGEHASSDITGLIGQYAHGNEPSHHIAYFYTLAGAPHKTQDRLNQILQTLYQPTTDGISGNEDCGAMSAWYVMNALGFYQICPGNPVYTIGRPLIDQAQIELPNGKVFTIQVENNSLTNKYVDRATLNDQPLKDLTFYHEDIKKGGILKIWMKP